MRQAAWWLLIIAAFAACAASAEEPFVYRAERGDTLIGLGKRLLAVPAQWRSLQKLNRIGDPRRIPVGSEIRIPVSWLRRVPESARILTVRGQADAGGQPLQADELLAEGAIISTGTDGYVTIVLTDGSEFTIEPDSRLQLVTLHRLADTNLRDISVVLERGRVETRAASRKPGDAGRFEIRSRVAAAAVRGTEFRVGADDAAARSEVLTGIVTFQGLAAARQVELNAGFGSFVRGPSPPAEPKRLLPAPNVATLPTLQERTVVRFDLPASSGVQAWRAQVATDREFRDVLSETQSDAPVLRFPDLDDGDYWLRVRAVDKEGLEGFDAYHRFRLKARPEPPFPSTPAAGAKLPAGPLFFSWSQPADVGVARYRLQVGHDEKFASPVRDEDGLTGSTYTVEGLDPGDYWWRIQSIRADADRGPFGDPQAFTLRPLPADPNPPALGEKELQFSWPALPGQTFLFQLSQDPQFSRIEVERILVDPRIALERPSAGVYYMRVRATDPDGYVGPFTTTQQVEVPSGAPPWWLLFLLVVPFM